MTIVPFTITIDQETLDDLKYRLKNTRWPDEVTDAGWEYGSNLTYMKDLINYWQHDFDWRVQETALNCYPQFKAIVDDLNIHFIHIRGKGKKSLPLVLIHGWPATFFQMMKIIPLLVDPGQHGGDPDDSFDIIIPSLPGFGFSDRPTSRGMSCARIGDMIHTLLTQELGYSHYGIRASDIGSTITQHMALSYTESVIGIHLNGGTPLMGPPPSDLSDAEQQFLRAGQMFMMSEGAYAMVQATKPQTLAYGLMDSPAALAGWIVEKFRAWSDCSGDIENRFTKDELLTNLMIYWVTGTIHSSCRVYYETMHTLSQYTGTRVEIPTGMTQFPKDLVPAVREWEERFYNIQHWTEMPRGGHFAEMEEPVLLAEDIRTFFRMLRMWDK